MFPSCSRYRNLFQNKVKEFAILVNFMRCSASEPRARDQIGGMDELHNHILGCPEL